MFAGSANIRGFSSLSADVACFGLDNWGMTSEQRRGLSVRARILVSMLSVAAAGMAIAGATAYAVQRERTLNDLDDRLVAAVDDARFIATDGGAATVNDALTAVIQRIRPGTNETTLGVIDGTAALTPGGQVDFRVEDIPGFVDRIDRETAAGSVVRGTATEGGRTVRYVAVPISVSGSTVSGVFVDAFDVNAELAPLSAAFQTFALVALAALIVVGLVGWMVSGRLLRPIRELRNAAARITASDVSERIPVSGRDDVSELTTTVNGMLDRLDGALTGQRRLLDDVGHELKTPITIVRGHLELMDASDPTDVAATRELAIDELDRMAGLVRDISTLSELQHPLLLDRRPTDIADLTERVRTKAAGLSPHDWVVSEAADVTAVVDSERLTQAMLQLAANAVTHGATANVIEIGSGVVRSASAAPRLQLWVRDDGVGMNDETQQHIFERFRRGFVGRGASGSGLGLAIVSSIASAHGGTVAVRSSLGGGSTFTIELPLETAEAATSPGTDVLLAEFERNDQ